MERGTWNDVSNKADWIDCIEFIDQETDEPIDMSSVQDIVLQIMYPQSSESNPIYGGYSGAYNWNGASVSLKTGGIEHVQLGVIQFHFTAGVMRSLPPQLYNMGLAIVSQEGIISQIIIGTVPVLEGFNLAAVT